VPGTLVISGQWADPPSPLNEIVFKAHRLCVSLNSRLESNKEEEEYAIRLFPRAAGPHPGEDYGVRVSGLAVMACEESRKAEGLLQNLADGKQKHPLLPEVNRGSTFALRRPPLDFCLGETKSFAAGRA